MKNKKKAEDTPVLTEDVLELKRLLTLKPEPPATVLGPLVLAIQKAQPELVDRTVAELVGTYPSKIRYSRLVMGLPSKIQDHISARRVTITIIERLIPLHTRIPEGVLIRLTGRIVADKLNTDEARALTEVVSSVYKDINRAKGTYTKGQKEDMYTTAILSPVKEKGVDPAEVALSISRYVKGEEDKPKLLISPAQVKFAESIHKEQPLYLRQRQKEFNKFLGEKGQVSIMRTDAGICVEIICADEDIPEITRRMYESTPSKAEEYSDATVDLKAQTVKVTDVFGGVITDESFIRVAEALRTGTIISKGQKSAGKDITRHIEVDGVAYLLENRTDIDVTLEIHCRVMYKEVIYTEQGCLITSKTIQGRRIHD